MRRDELVARMLADLQHAAQIRGRFMEGDSAVARQGLRTWQAGRLARTHADLLASPRYGKAATFFLTDLYGPDATFTRYAEAERAMPITVRLLPQGGLETIADAWQLDAISETLDADVIAALGGRTDKLTSATYAAAYRTVGRADDRALQIDLIGKVAHTLERFAGKRFALTALHMMREPARLAGFGDLQGFLERGLIALHDMGPVAPFIETITRRERHIMEALMAGDATALETPPAPAN